MADLLLIRHGVTEKQGTFLGQLDVPLSPRGRAQAAAIVLETRFARVYASPLRRAQETAAALGRPFLTVPALAEISYGPWEGLSWAEIEALYPAEAARKMADWLGYTVPGAESWSDFQARVLSALPPPDEDAVIVAHLGVNSILHEHLHGGSPMQFEQQHGEVLRYSR